MIHSPSVGLSGALIFRAELGKDLVIVALSMSSKERRKRVLLRHDGDVSAADKMDVSPVIKLELENTFRNITAVCKPHGAGGGGRAEDDRGPGDKFHDKRGGGGGDQEES